MILEIDMGNTRLKWRLKSQLSSLAAGSIPISTGYEPLQDIISEHKGKLIRVLVASVRTNEEERAFASWIKVHVGIVAEFARSTESCGLVTNGYAEPSLLGVDRWLAVIAGYHRVRNTCVIVSAGTALTVDLVAHNGRHQGGYIAPGISLFGATLSQSTARIKLGENKSPLELSPGNTTISAVGNACAAMIQGIIDNALDQIKVIDKCEKVDLLLSGGDAGCIKMLYPWAEHGEELVLDGLSYLFGLRSIINGNNK
jgi:type III pantothenate kinase